MASKLIISDPEAVRAMASPVRFLAVDELYTTQRAMTATQLAQVSGASPSTMSYHLRELQRLGIVRRDTTNTDRRSRPWRACADDYVIQASDDADPQDRVSLIDSHLRPMQQRMVSVLNERAGQSPQDRHNDPYRVLVGQSLDLTDEQIRALSAEIDQLVEKYSELSRHRTSNTSAVQQIELVWTLVPKDPRSCFTEYYRS